MLISEKTKFVNQFVIEDILRSEVSEDIPTSSNNDMVTLEEDSRGNNELNVEDETVVDETEHRGER
jgi:hypothetical protein